VSFSKEDLEEFKSEAFEILEIAEKSLFKIEDRVDFKNSFDAVFRALHNLKGASGMMELLSLQNHVHELETIFMKFKEASSIPKAYIDFFLRGIDGAKTLLLGGEIQFDYSIPEVVVASETIPVEPPVTKDSNSASALDEFVSEGCEIIERVSSMLALIEKKLYRKDDLNDLYRDVHSLKGAAYLFGFTSIGDIAHAMESSLEPLREGTHIQSLDLMDMIFKSVRFIEVEMDAIKHGTQSDENRKLGPALIRGLSQANQNLKPNLEVVELKMDEKSSPVVLAPALVQSEPQDREKDSASSIRVPVALLDNLMTLMGEMVLVRNQVLQFSNNSEDLDFLNLSKRLNVVTSEIQGEMMKTRMQPIGNVLSKYNRVVRDLSQELRKNITLNLYGSETELDKSLLESIKDPLTHIVRNSCDHGIENPETRMATGKSENGNISIRAYHEGGQVVIEVTDDGKGLHRDALLKKALEKGLVTQAQTTNMTEKEIFNLIFAPGFSTAAVVTNVSGRGVGMDVVRTNIEKIGGTVELSSVAGRGTTTKIKIPLTLAIIPALIIRSGSETFAIPQVKLEELVRVEQAGAENKIEYLHGAPVFRLRGNILPLVDLNKILGVKKADASVQGAYNIAVLTADQGSFGLMVDEIQDTADIVVKPLNRLLRSLQVYSGATILGDGSIALILDIQGISKVAHVGTGKGSMKVQRSDQKMSSDFQEYLLVGLNSPTRHALVLGYVNRLEEFKRSALELSGKMRVIRYGKSILPIISVSELLGYGVSESQLGRETISVVVIQKGGVFYGLEVEEIVDTLSTDADVDSEFTRQPGFFGNLNTPDGLIVAIDPFEIIGLAYPEKAVGASLDHAQPLALKSPKAKRELKILFVEDTVFFRKAVTIILQKEGHDVTIAVDGKEGVEILNKYPEKFDLIISDIEMPRMNGFELAQAIRSNHKFASLPLLALSSRADKKYADMGIKAGFNRYLEKLKPGILVDAISDLVNIERKSA
jgi:two-component system chemotaxis sensor kinase CheA